MITELMLQEQTPFFSSVSSLGLQQSINLQILTSYTYINMNILCILI